MYLCMYVCKYICMYVFMYVCMYALIVCICTLALSRCHTFKKNKPPSSMHTFTYIFMGSEFRL